MKVRRILTAITIFLVVVICGVSTGFAIFYFAPEDKVTTIDDNRIDDIEENYNLRGGVNNTDYYDVYFFAQPLVTAQNSNQAIDISAYVPNQSARSLYEQISRNEVLHHVGSFYGYWENGDSSNNVNIQQYQDTYGNYVGYKQD